MECSTPTLCPPGPPGSSACPHPPPSRARRSFADRNHTKTIVLFPGNSSVDIADLVAGDAPRSTGAVVRGRHAVGKTGMDWGQGADGMDVSRREGTSRQIGRQSECTIDGGVDKGGSWVVILLDASWRQVR